MRSEKKKVIIVGAGGHGKVIADIIKLNGDEIIGYLDDKSPEELPDYKIIGKTSEIKKDENWYIIAVGDSYIREKLMKTEANWYTAIHPTAVVASDVTIGEGTCVMANVVINPGTKVKKGVIINTAVTIDHDCKIEQFVHIAPGSHLSGTVTVEEHTWIGVGSIVSNNIKICSKCKIGAGGVVIKDITKAGTYVGVPVKNVRK